MFREKVYILGELCYHGVNYMAFVNWVRGHSIPCFLELIQ